jgi:hypothetical protein
VPPNATCAPLPTRDSLELFFPEGFTAPHALAASTLLARFTPKVQRVSNGVRILSLDSLRLSLLANADDDILRINKVSGVQLGREEIVYIDRNLIAGITDNNFEVVADSNVLDLLLTLKPVVEEETGLLQEFLSKFGSLNDLLTSLDMPPVLDDNEKSEFVVPAVIARGVGASTVPDMRAAAVYVADDTACSGLLPRSAAVAEVIVVKRGGCTFADKIANVPDSNTVKLVVVEDFESSSEGMVAPVVDGVQLNAWGRSRANKIGLVMVRAGVEWERVKSVAVKKRVGVWVQGKEVGGLEIT